MLTLKENLHPETHATLQGQSASTNEPSAFGYYSFNDTFYSHIVPVVDDFMYTRLKLADSSEHSRSSIAARCKPMDLLQVDFDCGSTVNPASVAVSMSDGSRLGFLNRPVARQIWRDANKPKKWYAIFKAPLFSDLTGEITEVTIVLVRMHIPEEPEC